MFFGSPILRRKLSSLAIRLCTHTKVGSLVSLLSLHYLVSLLSLIDIIIRLRTQPEVGGLEAWTLFEVKLHNLPNSRRFPVTWDARLIFVYLFWRLIFRISSIDCLDIPRINHTKASYTYTIRTHILTYIFLPRIFSTSCGRALHAEKMQKWYIIQKVKNSTCDILIIYWPSTIMLNN